MSQLYEIFRVIRLLGAHPLALVIISALIAAILEQRQAKKRTPDFSSDDRDAFGRPAPKQPY